MNNLTNDLAVALGLPKNTISASLHLKHDELPVLKTESYYFGAPDKYRIEYDPVNYIQKLEFVLVPTEEYKKLHSYYYSNHIKE
jgi:hypothetical protein